MPNEHSSGPTIVACIGVLLIAAFAVIIQLQTERIYPTPAPEKPVLHFEADIPVRTREVTPDAGHILSGIANPDEAPAPCPNARDGQIVYNRGGRLCSGAPVAPSLFSNIASWTWTAPLPFQLQSGNTCTQQGEDSGGTVIAVREWRPRRNGRCYEEDAAK